MSRFWKRTMRSYFLLMIWALLQDVAIRRWGNSGYKGMNVVIQQVGCDPCAEKVSLTPLPQQQQQQPEPLIQGRIDPCFHMVYAKFWWYHQYDTVELETCKTRQHLSQPVSYPVCWPCPGWWWTLRSTCGWGREMCSGWECSQCQTWDLWPGSGMWAWSHHRVWGY